MPVPSVVVRPIAAIWRRRTLAVPLALAAALTASTSGTALIHVHSGDTLSAIAARYHTSVAALVALNHLPGDGNLIYAGQTLRVRAPATRSRSVAVRHTVVVGDTLSGIAARYRVRPARIERLNHLHGTVVVLGTSLVISHRRVRATAAGSDARTVLDHHSEPDRAATGDLIRSIAAQWGVDPSLALAIAWQESGWQMREVSSVGAIGAMQVMPGTGAYLSADVVHRDLDLYDARDNITAGVAFLSILTHEASSTSDAIAGYYQGLQSVQQHGMYPSTKQYVADVLSLRRGY